MIERLEKQIDVEYDASILDKLDRYQQRLEKVEKELNLLNAEERKNIEIQKKKKETEQQQFTRRQDGPPVKPRKKDKILEKESMWNVFESLELSIFFFKWWKFLKTTEKKKILFSGTFSKKVVFQVKGVWKDLYDSFFVYGISGNSLLQNGLKFFLVFFCFSEKKDPDYIPEDQQPPPPNQKKLHKKAIKFIRERIEKLEKLKETRPDFISWETAFLRKEPEDFKPFQTRGIKSAVHLCVRFVIVFGQKILTDF